MIGFIAAGLFAALLSTAVNAGADYKQMHVKFAVINGYYEMPATVKELKENFQDFVLEKHIWDLNVNAYAYKDNPQFSLLFDSYGNIAGIRTGYEKAEIPKRGQSNGKVFPADFFTKKPGFRSETIWGIEVWSMYALFTSKEKLKAGGRNDTGGLVLDDLYLNSTGTFSKIDKNECQAEKLGFHKQACFIGMGMHHFYNMTTSLDCDYFNGQFLLYECNQLIGFGLIPFGSFASKKRTWFEDPSVSAVEAIVPHRPACLTEYINNFGSSSLHVFFKTYPRLTFCTWPWQKDNQCNEQKSTESSSSHPSL